LDLARKPALLLLRLNCYGGAIPLTLQQQQQQQWESHCLMTASLRGAVAAVLARHLAAAFCCCCRYGLALSAVAAGCGLLGCLPQLLLLCLCRQFLCLESRKTALHLGQQSRKESAGMSG
jgi:hypothetical protein